MGGGVKSSVLHARLRSTMKIGLPWKKKELYKWIKKDEKYPDLFMKFSTFQRRLRQPEVNYIEHKWYEEHKDYRYVMREVVADVEPCVFSKMYIGAMQKLAAGKERVTWWK